MVIVRETPTLTDRLRTRTGKLLYPPVDSLCRYQSRSHEEVRQQSIALGESLALEEPFLADVVRVMYRTLEYFKIPDPRREAIRKQYNY